MSLDLYQPSKLTNPKLLAQQSCLCVSQFWFVISEVSPVHPNTHRHIPRRSLMCGTTCASLLALPKQFKYFKAATQEVKSAEKLPNSFLIQKYRVEQFPKNFYASGDKLYCKICQHNGDWKHVDMCKEKKMRALSFSNMSIRG